MSTSNSKNGPNVASHRLAAAALDFEKIPAHRANIGENGLDRIGDWLTWCENQRIFYLEAVLIEEFQGADGDLSGYHFAIVVSKYHHSITGKLLDGANETLIQNLVPASHIKVLWVAGAWEIPSVVQQVLETGKFDAVLTLGCVIRGETTHDQHINTTVSNGLGKLALDYSKPVAFGVLTCNSMEQAIDRAGGRVGNKGVETAEAAIQTLRLIEQLRQSLG